MTEVQDFLAGVQVNYWDGLYAEELLAKYFGIVSGFGEVLS